jgi:hypothetical protein
VDLFSSDNHGDTRALATAREWLRQFATNEHVELLTRTNAQRVLNSEPILPVPPLPRQRGMLQRLRRMFLRQ